MKRTSLVLALFISVAAIGTMMTPVAARAETSIISATVQNNYPKNLTFKLTAKADVEITDVSLS